MYHRCCAASEVDRNPKLTDAAPSANWGDVSDAYIGSSTGRQHIYDKTEKYLSRGN